MTADLTFFHHDSWACKGYKSTSDICYYHIVVLIKWCIGRVHKLLLAILAASPVALYSNLQHRRHSYAIEGI